MPKIETSIGPRTGRGHGDMHGSERAAPPNPNNGLEGGTENRGRRLGRAPGAKNTKALVSKANAGELKFT